MKLCELTQILYTLTIKKILYASIQGSGLARFPTILGIFTLVGCNGHRLACVKERLNGSVHPFMGYIQG